MPKKAEAVLPHNKAEAEPPHSKEPAAPSLMTAKLVESQQLRVTAHLEFNPKDPIDHLF